MLYTEWASVAKWYRCQPLDYVKDYFGVKIGLYFAWLGYYTYMLLLASVVGFACFLYAVFTLKYDVPRYVLRRSSFIQNIVYIILFFLIVKRFALVR